MNTISTVSDHVPQAAEAATIRVASPADVAPLTDMLLRLGDRSRYLRYHVSWRMTRQTAQREAERMLARDGRLSLLMVRRRAGVPEVLAVGELVPTGDGDAELAILVRDDLQRRGLGARLGRSLLGMARELGVRRVRADVLAENWGARRLLGCLGLERQVAAGYGTLQFEATLAS